MPGTVPPAMSGSATTSTEHHNFAIHDLFLGDTSFTGVPSTTAAPTWGDFGYNIDGLITTPLSKDVCELQDGAPSTAQEDGPGGVDNSFGANIDSLLSSGVQLTSQSLSKSDIQTGKFTIQLDTVGLDHTNTMQTATGLGGSVFAGTNYGSTPPTNAAGTGFAITDDWPVNGALLNGGTIAGGSTITFPSAYVTKGTWVNGSTAATIPLTISLAGQSLTLTISHAFITFNYSVDATGQGHATGGLISGVITTTDFVSALNVIGPGLPGGCGILTEVLAVIEPAQDIISDGTNKPGVPCDAISIGLGFVSDEIAEPTMVAPEVDAGASAPCGSDAGAGTGTGTGTGAGSSGSGSGSSGSGSGSSGSGTGTGT
jgi:hypothetical protein